MPGTLADDFHVDSIHQKVADVCVPKAVECDGRHFCGGDQATESFGQGVWVQRFAVDAGEDEAPRISAEPELQPFLGLGRSMLLQCLYGEGRQGDRAAAGLCLRRFPALRSRSDQRKPKSSPRRTPVVVATNTGR